MRRAYHVVAWLPVLMTACQQHRADVSTPRQMLVFDDPGYPPSGQTLFDGTNQMSSATVPNGNIASSLLACGAKELTISDADMSHTWSVAIPEPANPAAFIQCVSRHAGPMTFRVRKGTS